MPSSRVSAALRELASALEEADRENTEGFEVVSASAPFAESSGRAEGASGSDQFPSAPGSGGRGSKGRKKATAATTFSEPPEGFSARAGCASGFATTW